MSINNTAKKVSARTPEQIREEQKRAAEKELATRKAALPAAQPKPANPTPAAPVRAVVPITSDTQVIVDEYIDLVAPATVIGRLIKFTKVGTGPKKTFGFVCTDAKETKLDENKVYAAICDWTMVGYVKFNGSGVPPDRHMGLLYDGFKMPPRETLGDLDKSKWELGLNAEPTDPFQHHMCLVLQGGAHEFFTFDTATLTGRRAVGNLLRHYNRTQKIDPGYYPLIKLVTGGFQHRDPRVGWVATPQLIVVGQQKKGTAIDTSLETQLNDELPI